MNIILIGMRGSGKSTVGKLLADKLRRSLIETDELVEKKASGKLSDFIRKNGWEKFRSVESKVVGDVTKMDNVIISTGGGVVENPENIKILAQNGFIIYLKTNIDILLTRIGKDKNRPLLTDAKNMEQDLQNVFRKRKNLYENAAQLIVATDSKTVHMVVEEIIMHLKKERKL